MSYRFQNVYPHSPHRFFGALRWKLGLGPKEKRPVSLAESNLNLPVPVAPNWSAIHRADPRRLQVTWIGHATFLIQAGGLNLLTDPVYSTYCSPVPWPRMRRLFAPSLPWESLPRIDGVLISHAHYDHLDKPTISRLHRATPIWVPQGLKPWFEALGFKETRELAWWKSERVSSTVKLHACPAQHFAARHFWDWNKTSWCGWLLETPQGTVYFAGDTGYCPVFREIARRLPDIDLAILPIGAYRPRWFMQAVHTNPEEAVRIHLDLGTRYSVPGHWGTFYLTDEPLGEPAVLLNQARTALGVSLERFPLLRLGQTFVVPSATSTTTANHLSPDPNTERPRP